MDAKTLFQQGVDAIRANNLAEGRRLLAQSLKLNPESDLAWMWISRTFTDDPARRRQALERAVKVNPNNQKARELLDRLNGSDPSVRARRAVPLTTTAEPSVVGSDGELIQETPRKRPHQPNATEQRQIATLLKKADLLLAQDDPEGAIEQWVSVLAIQPDHEEAMRNAIKQLVKLNYTEDAKELLWRAIDAGTEHPSIFLTAIDLAKREGDHLQLEQLRQQIVRLPTVDESIINKIADEYLMVRDLPKARATLKDGLETYPENQKLLMKMGNLLEDMGRPSEATIYYNRAAKISLKTKEGKEADKKLSQFAPVLTDRERGSILLATREAAAFGVFYLLLAWQDAGLNLIKLGITRWLGVLLSVIGGYLVVTATSSPHQVPIARMLGGVEPPKKKSESLIIKQEISGALEEPSELAVIPQTLRYILGGIGAVVLLVAFTLVFAEALELLFDPVRPNWEYLLIEPE